MRLRIVLAALAFLGAGLGFGLSWREARIARVPLGADAAVFRQLLRDAPRRGASLSGDLRLMRACDAALAGRVARLQPEAARLRVARNCAALAESAREATPWSGIVLYAEALARQKLDAPPLAASRLLQAQSAAPFESWQAMRRLLLALEILGNGTAEAPRPESGKSGADDAGDTAAGMAAQTLKADIAALLQSRAGRRFLARNIQRHEMLRSQVMALLPTRAPAEQEAFLRAARAALEGRN